MSDFLGLKGKRAVVSGCFSGMGNAAAKILLDLGAEVHGFDFRETDLPLASFNTVDLRDPASIEAGVKAVGGKIDILLNCAGLPGGGDKPPMDVMKVNFLGTRHVTDCVLQAHGARRRDRLDRVHRRAGLEPPHSHPHGTDDGRRAGTPAWPGAKRTWTRCRKAMPSPRKR